MVGGMTTDNVRAYVAGVSFPELKHGVVHAVRQQWGAQ
jgi:hypothetical protein